MEWPVYWETLDTNIKKSATKPRTFFPFLLISAFICLIHRGQSILTRVMQADVTNKHQNFIDTTQLKLISWMTVQIQVFLLRIWLYSI